MKSILTGMFLLFFASPLFAQDSVVTIKPNTARYFLEVDDKLKVYEIRDSLNQQLISNLTKQLELKDDQINLYELDQLGYETFIETKTLEIKSLERNNRRLRTKGKLFGIGIGVAFLAGLLINN